MIPIMFYDFDLSQLFFYSVSGNKEGSYNRVLAIILLIQKQKYKAKHSAAIVNMPAILTVKNSFQRKVFLQQSTPLKSKKISKPAVAFLHEFSHCL